MMNFFRRASERPSTSTRQGHRPCIEPLEDRCCPSLFQVIGATGSPTSILDVKVFDDAGNLTSSVTPFNNLTSLRVATGDFDGDGSADEFAVLGRRTGIDFRAEIVTYDLDNNGLASETGRFFAFDDASILGNGYLAAGDFDGDGDDDLAVAQIGGGRDFVTVQAHYSQGNGVDFAPGGSTFESFGLVSAPRVGAGDIDGDGFAEIIVAARTSSGAEIRVFAADSDQQPVLQGSFLWDFGVSGYNRGAFVAVGEFNSFNIGAELVLGSNVGGGGRVDVISFGADGSPQLYQRFTPFGDGYTAAVRVATSATGPRILVGQDRFQNGQTAVAMQDFSGDPDRLDPNAPFVTGAPTTTLTAGDGLSPGNLILGPFVAFTDTERIATQGGMVALNPNTLQPINNVPPNVVTPGQTAVFQNLNPEGFQRGNPSNVNGQTVKVDLDISGDDLRNLNASLRYYDNSNNVVGEAKLINRTDVNGSTGRVNATFTPLSDTGLRLTGPIPGTNTQVGRYQSADNLSVFNNPAVLLGQGTWVLVLDNAAGGGGVTLNGWSIDFVDSDPPPVPTTLIQVAGGTNAVNPATGASTGTGNVIANNTVREFELNASAFVPPPGKTLQAIYLNFDISGTVGNVTDIDLAYFTAARSNTGYNEQTDGFVAGTTHLSVQMASPTIASTELLSPPIVPDASGLIAGQFFGEEPVDIGTDNLYSVGVAIFGQGFWVLRIDMGVAGGSATLNSWSVVLEFA